ncbi:hypothetical protein [Candidatus Magnetaquicoccus inordinatus]|uniref:hypothetical protein n=1 Tax=Candidatus Magnetaquicoccus inordinatus TaxID=2496818 RepID=UPI00102C9CA0|nr:hypothetical protein [Candidatus Magnetaquicoccus inordinatus]
MSGPFSGRTKFQFCQRLHQSWEDLADVLEPEIPRHERNRFRQGRECEDLWGWLEDRDRLDELPEALGIIKRGDLAQLLEDERRTAPQPSDSPAGRLQENLSQSGLARQASTSQALDSTDWDAFADLAELQIDVIREHIRAGRQHSALEQVNALKQRIFDRTPPSHQSRLLRLEATLRLSMAEPLEVIEALASRAKALFPHQDDHLLAVRLVDAREGAQSAKEFLGEPITLFESHFHATLLLELGSHQSARQWLQGDKHQQMLFSQSGGRDSFQSAETERLLALSCLFARNLGQAQLHVTKALEKEPGNELIRFALGAIYYCQALSPSLIPDRPVLFPYPSGKEMLRESSESLSYLDRAAELFRGLSNNQETIPSRRRVIEAWLLATLASHPERHKEGKNLCRQLLLQNPDHVGAIFLNKLAGYNLPMGCTVELLESDLEEHKATVQGVNTLLWLRFQKAHPKIKQLRIILDKSRTLFTEAGLEQNWHYWDIFFEAYAGEINKALTKAEILESHKAVLELKCNIRMLEARKSGKWLPVAESVLDLFRATGNGSHLYSACQIFAQEKAWERVADLAKELVQTLATPAALKLAAVALWNRQAYQECFTLLEEHWERLLSDIPPARISWIRIQCQRLLGNLPRAVREAEDLYRRESLPQYGISLFDQYVECGDLKQAALWARELMDRHDMSAEFLLSASHIVLVQRE